MTTWEDIDRSIAEHRTNADQRHRVLSRAEIFADFIRMWKFPAPDWAGECEGMGMKIIWGGPNTQSRTAWSVDIRFYPAETVVTWRDADGDERRYSETEPASNAAACLFKVAEVLTQLGIGAKE